MVKQKQNLRRSLRLLAKEDTAKSRTEKGPEKKTRKQPTVELGSKKKRAKDRIFKEESSSQISAECAATMQAFGNHLILSKIISGLRTTDLINCRMVNSSWKETADKILGNRTDLKTIDLRITGLRERKFVLNSLQSHELSELQNILENSINFPCTSFKIQGPLYHPDLQSFFSSCGSHIRKLHLDFTYDNNPREENIPHLRKLLTTQVVNLHSLTLETILLSRFIKTNFTFVAQASKLFPSKVRLPKLLHLEIKNYGNFYYYWRNHRIFSNMSKVELAWALEIVKAAPNLQSFLPADIDIEPMESLVNLNRSNLLKEVTLGRYSDCPQDDQILSQFKLHKLNRELHRRDISSVNLETAPNFVRLLNLNVDTLTSISLEYLDAERCLQTTNVFQHVHTFCLKGFDLNKLHWETFGWIEIPIHHLFPNLETARLEIQSEHSREPRDFGTTRSFPFLTSEPLEKVKTLEIQNGCPKKWVKLLPQVFPNVVNLILENYWAFSESGHLFWAFSSLKYMHLGLLGIRFGVDNLDPIFTGFPGETCQKLEDKLEKGQKVETEGLRIASSIVQLKNLRKLRIKVTDTNPRVLKFCRQTGLREEGSTDSGESSSSSTTRAKLISRVTSMYAFGMMPSLQAVEILLTPIETEFLPWNESSLGGLQELAADLAPMAKQPLLNLYPIQMNHCWEKSYYAQ